MNPIAFYLFGIGIRSYGIAIAAGMALGLFVAKFNCRYREVNFDTFLDVILIAVPAGLIGARLYYVIFQFNEYQYNLIDIVNIRQGGLAIHGGILFALVTAFLVARNKKVDFLKIADIAAPSVILAQALGRWGNFFNSEAHGGPVSYEFIKHFPLFIQNGMLIDGVYYQPTFLYESLWDVSVFVILMLLLRKVKMNGLVFFTYVGLYSIGRFFIEGQRTDSLMLGPVRVAQLVSLVGMAIWLVFLVYQKQRNNKSDY